MSKKKIEQKIEEKVIPLKLDLGSGKNKRKDGDTPWTGVDAIAFEGVDIVSDVLTYLKALEEETVDAVNMSHFLEHFAGPDRVPLMNEVCRVMKKGTQCLVTCPCWSHERAFGDPQHFFPPICTWTFFYMNKDWRDTQAPHCGYTCDFDYQVIGAYDPNDASIQFRTPEAKGILMTHSINYTTDIIATLTKK
jgi:hypothetical protein